MQASKHVQLELLAEVRSIAAARRDHSRQTMLAIAAVIVGAAAITSWRLTPPLPTLTDSTLATSTSADVMTAFLPLVYGAVPTTASRIVRMELPQTALAAFGL